jgi:hypothetical protein
MTIDEDGNIKSDAQLQEQAERQAVTEDFFQYISTSPMSKPNKNGDQFLFENMTTPKWACPAVAYRQPKVSHLIGEYPGAPLLLKALQDYVPPVEESPTLQEFKKYLRPRISSQVRSVADGIHLPDTPSTINLSLIVRDILLPEQRWSNFQGYSIEREDKTTVNLEVSKAQEMYCVLGEDYLDRTIDGLIESIHAACICDIRMLQLGDTMQSIHLRVFERDFRLRFEINSVIARVLEDSPENCELKDKDRKNRDKESSTDWTSLVPIQPAQLVLPKQEDWNITFHDGDKELGRFEVNEKGKLCFKGDADLSAHMFAAQMWKHWNSLNNQ